MEKTNYQEQTRACHPLGLEEAAAVCGFTLQTFAMWVRRGLLPGADSNTGGWTKAALDGALDRVKCHGVQHDNPSRRHSHFVKIYNCQRIWKELEQGEGAGHWLFYFRPTSERLPGPWGSPAFMQALIAAEQRAANPTYESPEQSQNQYSAVAQQSPETSSPAPKLVTQNAGNRGDEPRAGGVLNFSRRRAQVKQADLARIIRAAKQAGAAQIEVRLNDSSTVLIRLQPDNSLAQSEEIVL